MPWVLKAIAVTSSVWPSRLRRTWPVLASQRRITLSAPEDAIVLPSGEIATARAGPSWPCRVRRSLPAGSMSQSRTMRSTPPDASVRPSGENETDVTSCLIPRTPIVARARPVAASQRVMEPLLDDTAITLPSLE